MVKIKLVGARYGLLEGSADPGERGYVRFRAEEAVASLSVNGRAFGFSDEACRVPVTAFRIGSNRLSLRLRDGRTVPCEGIRLTGGLYSPEGATVADVIAACDRRFAILTASLSALSSRVKALEDDSGILP